MDRKIIARFAVLVAVTVVGQFFASSPATTDPMRSGRSKLLGSWTQVSDEERLPNGQVVEADEIGLVMYDDSGHMSEQVMRRSSPRQQIPSDEKYVIGGYDAYFGTFTVDEAAHTVTHHVVGSISKALVGKDLVRSYEFSGKRLTLKPVDEGEHWTVVLEKNR